MFNRSSYFTLIFAFVILPFSGCFLWQSGDEGDGDECSIASLGPEDFIANGGEYWESLTLDGVKIGFRLNKLTLESGPRSQNPLLRWKCDTKMKIFRLDKVSETRNIDTQLESPEGELLGFTKTIVYGTSPVTFIAEREGDNMVINQTSEGQSFRNSIPWNPAVGGPLAIQSSLARKPMQAGEKRSLVQYDIAFMDINLEAKNLEKCELPGGPKTLLRIEAEMIPEGETAPHLRATLWTDGGGIVCRTEMPYLGKNLVTVLCTQEEAIAEISEYPFIDIGPMAMFPLDRPIDDPYGASDIAFLVRIEGDPGPGDLFPQSPLQTVTRVAADTVEISVVSSLKVDPADPGMKTEIPPGREMIDPNIWLDYTAPSVERLTGLVFPDESENDPLRIGKILENFVHKNIKPGDDATAFASASETAVSLRGDCTEYAVLLAAMARAKGIPSRVVLGLVYTQLATPDRQKSGAMAFHMWTELYIDGAWIPFDATLGLGGADAARIRIADSGLSGESFQSLLLKAFVLGKKIEIRVLDEKP